MNEYQQIHAGNWAGPLARMKRRAQPLLEEPEPDHLHKFIDSIDTLEHRITAPLEKIERLLITFSSLISKVRAKRNSHVRGKAENQIYVEEATRASISPLRLKQSQNKTNQSDGGYSNCFPKQQSVVSLFNDEETGEKSIQERFTLVDLGYSRQSDLQLSRKMSQGYRVKKQFDNYSESLLLSQIKQNSNQRRDLSIDSSVLYISVKPRKTEKKDVFVQSIPQETTFDLSSRLAFSSEIEIIQNEELQLPNYDTQSMNHFSELCSGFNLQSRCSPRQRMSDFSEHQDRKPFIDLNSQINKLKELMLTSSTRSAAPFNLPAFSFQVNQADFTENVRLAAEIESLKFHLASNRALLANSQTQLERITELLDKALKRQNKS